METRQIHVKNLSTVTGIQQFEHEVQSIYFLGLEDFVGTIYLSMESDEYSNEAVPLTSNTFIIGQPMTIYNTTYTCQIYGVLDDGEKIQLSKRFRLIVDKSNTIQGESSEYPIDPNFKNSIIEFVNEQKSGLDTYTDDKKSEIEATGESVIESIPSDYSTLSNEVSDIRVGADGTTYPTAGDAVRGQIGDVKSQTSDLEQAVFDVSKNVYDPNTEWVNGTFSNGNLVEQTTGLNNAVEKDYIPVTANADWVISWKAVDINCTMYVEAYTSEDVWIANISRITMNAVTRYGTFTTPANCAYIRLRIYRSGANWQSIIPTEIQVELGTTPTEYEPKSKTSKFVAVDAELENLQEQIDQNPAIVQRRQVATNTNVLFPSVKGYLKDDGTFNTTTSGWQRSDYIPVEPNTFMYFHGITRFSYFGFFDANKTWIGGKNIETPVVSDNSYLISHQVPSNAYYMIVSFVDTDAPTAWGNYTPTIPTGKIIYANTDTLRAYKEYPTNPCDYEGLDACAFRKGLCIGDSLTGGGFNYSSGTNPWADGNVYSYPAQFEKMTGIPMTNEGHSGRTTVQWWEHYGTGGDTAIYFSGYDFAIIHLGVNDVSYSVPTEDTRTAYQNIINALKTANTGIKIFVCTIIPAYAIDGITTYDTINTMIKSFAEQENVYCCDLTRYGHTYKNSEYTAGHLTAYGYWRMAKDLISYIGYIMREKPADFRFIQYIGTDMSY